MRVCMLVRNACVRDARVLREARTLAEHGHDLVVLGTAEPGIPAAESRDGFRIRRIEPIPPWIRRLADRPLIATQGGDSPAAAPATPPPRPWPLLAVRDRIISGRFAAAATAAPADVYHAHDLNTLEAAAAAARTHRAQLVYDAHELYPKMTGFSPGEARRWSRIERRLIRRADRVVTVSEGLAENLASEYGIPVPTVLLNCPERPASPPDPRSSSLWELRRPGEMLVLYTGGIYAKRGLEALVDAAERARGWRLVMVGWGRMEAALRERAPSIAFLGAVPPSEIVALSSGADAGVVPYVPLGLNNALSMPNKLFDYVHAGLAVAASNLVQIRRFLDRWGVGITFEPGDARSIGAVLDALAADPARLATMRAATDAAAAACDWNVEKQKLVEIYDSLGP